jgi:hypothetical protein
MLHLDLQRYAEGDESCLGILFERRGHDLEFLGFTLEDIPREKKIAGITGIPAGTYQIKLRKEGGFHAEYSRSGHWAHDIHKGMLWLQDVPGFEHILLHPGNRDDDTKGCILVGDSASQNITEEGSIGSSRNAYRRIYPPIAAALEAGELVIITVS